MNISTNSPINISVEVSLMHIELEKKTVNPFIMLL